MFAIGNCGRNELIFAVISEKRIILIPGNKVSIIFLDDNVSEVCA